MIFDLMMSGAEIGKLVEMAELSIASLSSNETKSYKCRNKLMPKRGKATQNDNS